MTQYFEWGTLRYLDMNRLSEASEAPAALLGSELKLGLLQGFHELNASSKVKLPTSGVPGCQGARWQLFDLCSSGSALSDRSASGNS